MSATGSSRGSADRLGLHRIVAIGVIVALTVAFLLVAFRAEGNPATRIDLNDAGIWLTKSSTQEIGRLNADLRLTDAKLNVASQQFELLQSGGTVLVRVDDRLRSIDVRIPQSRGETTLPAGAVLALGGPTAAVLDPLTGALWVADGLTIGTTDYEMTEPNFVVPGGDDVVVGVDGVVHVLDRDAGLVLRVERGSQPVEVITLGRLSDKAMLSAVGSEPVILDDRALYFRESRVDLGRYDPPFRLQQPGPPSKFVVIATATELVQADLETSIVTTITSLGTENPVAPVVVDGCTFGAWAGVPVTVASCPGAELIVRDIPQAESNEAIRFRVNRNRVALNVLSSGGAILFTDGDAVYVNDWSQALDDDDDDSDDDTADLTDEIVIQDRVCDRTGNQAPVAAPDRVATRQGRPIVIRPLMNDVDVNCDVLTIEIGEIDASMGQVAMIEGSRALQFSPPPDRTATVTIPYTVSDGIASDTSVIVIEIRAVGVENEPPETVDDETFVAQGRTVSHNVLVNDTDPDGDILALQLVEDPDRGGDIRFRPDGQVVYTAPIDLTGEVTIVYIAIDESGATSKGVLTVTVVPSGDQNAPIARSDHAVGFVGEEITVAVLENDSDADGDAMVLSGVSPSLGTVMDIDAGTITFSSSEAGAFRFTYALSDGRSSEPSEGSLRIDVFDRGEVRPPVAVRDDVVVIPGVATIIDVLANDFEPDGDVLVLRSVGGVPDDLTVEIIDRELLRITANTADTSRAFEFEYRVSDGVSEAVGLVIVRPVSVGGENQVPVLAPDTSRVHAGGIVTIPVLDNDYDPDGDILVLESATVREPAGQGLFVVVGESLRFLAPREFEGTVTGMYTVFDGFNRVSATIRVRVKRATAEDNLAPNPPLVTARTFVGTKVRIPLPIATMDPDGNPVEILGISDVRGLQPRLGQVIEITNEEIVYLPFNVPTAVGTDRFAYIVRDSFGAVGTGIIEVGIVPLPDVNGRPVAIDDTFVVSLGGRVILQPLLNDSDPEGARLVIVERDLIVPDPGSVRLVSEGTALEFTAPNTEGVVILGYSIVDPGGATDSATIEIVISETAGNLPPVAVDDLLSPMPSGSMVIVAVLENDIDPDGVVSDLTVEVVGFPEAVVNADGTVSFTMIPGGVAFAYTITDPADLSLSSTAFVQVPALTNRPPVVPFTSIDTGYNETVSIDLLGRATDPDGDDLSIVDGSFVIARGSGSVTVEGSIATFDPDDRFSGEGGFTFSVSDGDLVTVGAVRVIVEVSGNSAPSFTILDLTIPAGSENSRMFDMKANVVDPDADASHIFLDLDRSQLDSSIRVTLSDEGELEVHATDPRSKGLAGPIMFTVDDGREEGITSATVNITVAGSDRPMPVARPDSGVGFDDLRQGLTAELDVLANDFDPFLNGTLEIISFGPVTPAAAGLVHQGLSNGRIVFTPAQDFNGTATIPYTITDETGDPERTSSATVTINIKGKPDAPSTPTGTEESRQVTLQWGVPSANGAPILNYEVRDETGALQCTSPTNSCTVTGLTNGETYRFVVRAINEVGESPDSDLSAPLTPDAKPDAPTAPATHFGDGELTVSWDAPNNEGSAITEFHVRITPGGVVETVGANTLTLVWSGLANGVPYSFEVRASNLTFDSEWSQHSAFDTPAGIPLNVPAPNPPQGGDQIVTVSWGEPIPNGAAIQAYEVTVYQDGRLISTVPIPDPGARSYTLTGATNGAQYQFAVRARNKAGWSASSSLSAAAVPSGKPLGISGMTASIGNGSVTLSYTAPEDNGAEITHYQVAVSTSNNPTSFSDFNGTTVGGLVNGQEYWFRVSACNINGCSDEPSNVVTANPCTAPSTPVIGTPSVDAKRITWNWSSSDDGGRSPVTYHLSGAGSGSLTGTSFTHTFPDYGTMYTLRVSASNTCPVSSQSGRASRSATTGAAPAPPAPEYFTLTSSTSDTCPELNPSNPVAWNPIGPTCSTGWVPRNSTIRVTCSATGFRAFGVNVWLNQHNSSLWIHAWGINLAGVPQC